MGSFYHLNASFELICHCALLSVISAALFMAIAPLVIHREPVGAQIHIA